MFMESLNDFCNRIYELFSYIIVLKDLRERDFKSCKKYGYWRCGMIILIF